MPEIGQTVSHYRILAKLGQGGMGEVYRAEDTNLSRQVAIKVLPEEFAHDAERLARFEREAKLLASLNHPNVATLYGLEESDGRRFIVMELVEGQTLAHRLLKGPLPLDEALEVCRQIAEGLEAAHEKGVIHRDLKPGNVMVTADDKVKILNFGLAKAFAGDSRPPDATHSPTITEAMTRPGVVLGTAAYMSPEQARGKPVDKRADIWAFGCILFECLAGKRAFEGETVTETLAAILKGEPDWLALPAVTASRVKDLLHRCLEKDPRRRLHDIADARIEIDNALYAPVLSTLAEPEDTQHGAPRLRPLALGLIVAQRLESAERQILIRGATYARYVPTGHLVYARAGALFGVPFDLSTLEVTGQPVLVLKGIMTVSNTGTSQFAFSDTGLLVYVPGTEPPAGRSLVWVDSHGVQQAIMPRLNNYGELAISPDGRRLAVRVAAANDDVWLYEPARDTLTRLTDEDGDEVCPVWTPKGERVAYSSEAGGPANLFWKAADGSGSQEPLLRSEHPKYPSSFTPDGQILAFVEIHPKTRADIWLLPVQGNLKPRPFLQTQFDEWAPKFSPDGCWLAYASNRSGRDEIYIQPFPGPGGRQQISTDGGNNPVWARSGQELFYRNGSKMMAVSIDVRSGKPGKNQILFEKNCLQITWFSGYDVAPDGRFLIVSEPEVGVALTRINIVQNWFEELKRLVPFRK